MTFVLAAGAVAGCGGGDTGGDGGDARADSEVTVDVSNDMRGDVAESGTDSAADTMDAVAEVGADAFGDVVDVSAEANDAPAERGEDVPAETQADTTDAIGAIDAIDAIDATDSAVDALPTDTRSDASADVPVVPLGGACDPSGMANVCATGSSCATSGSSSTCVADGAPGARCRATGTPCDAPDVCNGPTTAIWARCVPVIAIGGACDLSQTMNVCTNGSHCLATGPTTAACIADGTLNGQCRATGTPCDPPNACNGPPGAAGSYCRPVIPLGGACDPSGYSNVCASGTGCNTVGSTATCGRLPVESSIASACDDLTTVGIPLSVATGYVNTTGTIALPAGFAFTFFGASIHYYSVTTGGYMQLWPTTTGLPTADNANVAIPNTRTPNNFVAPFWGDLVTTNAVYAVFGTAPNRRFVFEWTTHVFTMSDVERFQVKLFETTGVIEFHYCSLMPALGYYATGGHATVGIENSNGIAGVQHSYNTPMSVSTAAAIRFTP